MRGLLFFLLCLFLSQGAPAMEQVASPTFQEREAVMVHWKPSDAPWPKYLPRGYRFQGVSYINTKRGKVTHLRFIKDEKLLSIFTKPTSRHKGKWRVKRKGEYSIIEWQKGAREFTLIGREDSGCLIKIAESIK